MEASEMSSNSKGIKARSEASRELISRHQAEFDEIHREKRTALGLPPAPAKGKLTDAEKRDRKIQRLRQQLRDLGETV